MAQRRKLTLTAEQVKELVQVRDHHEKAYMRERAAALLKVASGQSMLQVARHGLLKPRRYETISEWLDRYQRDGVQGLQVQRGRGRKPAFSPQKAPQDVEVAVAQLSETLHQSPECFGLLRSRWSLDGLRQAVEWMTPLSLPGIWQILDRFDLAYKRGRRYVHSPDPEYACKAARLRSISKQVQADPDHLVLLYEDELTYYRCPTVFCDYTLEGSDEPHANQGQGYNTSRRIAGCLDAFSGRLITWQRSAFDHHTFLRYLRAVQACYPLAERIYIALDNWPVHFQADVLSGLQESKITLVFLPTYSPWLNPIEKVWRKLKQELLHLHRYSSRWKDLQERVEQWLIQYDRPSPDLLHSVGLLPH